MKAQRTPGNQQFNRQHPVECHQVLGADMDAGTILGFTAGYFAAVAGIFFLHLPVIILFIALLIAAGALQLLLLPFVLLIRKLRRRPQPDTDASWLLDQPKR
ncbi:hypothetical protein [uncultured Arthrobacter sp.]|uniref:hypothetical protein n=1 Tax=uncultured Arthrobacter sp. TaxID=114050 RepID=UPI0028D70B98|nr:hypothetical protein [uncultured Arthrobacter sp.]